MKARINVVGIPEALAAMRFELARLLRDCASDETPPVAKRLLQIAAAFEAGASEL